MIFKNKDVKVIILEVFLIALGLVGLTLGVKYIMNSINVNVDTSKLAIDSMNANVTNGTLMPINDSTVNINTTSNVLRITFDVRGASTNTGNNIIYDAILNIDTDCSLKNENIKWNLYKNNNLLTSGTTSPKYDKDVLNGKITLTDTQQDLVKYSGTADKYVFILWMSETCNEEDITKCDISNAFASDSGSKGISGNIDIRLNSGKKKENKRATANITNVCTSYATYIVEHLDDGTTGDDGSGVYKIEHEAIANGDSATGNDIPPVTDYRYYGYSPNNYICLDMDKQSTCPDRSLYRIIGSIYEENADKNLIKVIKATPITDGATSIFSRDYKVTNGSGSYTNNWPTSTLMTLLNSGAWWSNNSGIYYNDSITAKTVNFTDKGLTDKAKTMINESLYYLGGGNSSKIYTAGMYRRERGTTTYKGNVLSWKGKVGLMYPSDYGYASGNSCATGTNLGSYNNICKYRGWLYNSSGIQWLMSPGSNNSNYVMRIGAAGHVNIYSSNSIGLVSPVFYLTSDVSITGGTGTSSDPYLLG